MRLPAQTESSAGSHTATEARDAIVRGLKMPVRMYFQPASVAREPDESGAGGHKAPSAVFVRLGSLAWLGICAVVGLVAFGPPETMLPDLPRVASLALVMLVPGLLMILVALEFASLGHDRMWAIGLVLGVTTLFAILALDEIAVQNNLDIAQVVDSPTLDAPAIYLYGVSVGVVFCMLAGYDKRARLVVMLGLAVGTGVAALSGLGRIPEGQQELATCVVTVCATMTHVIWQPFHLLVGLLANTAARVDPTGCRILWRISPASWSEFCYVPLPGLSGLVNALYNVDRQAGEQAIRWLRSHPFYGTVGRRLAKQKGLGQQELRTLPEESTRGAAPLAVLAARTEEAWKAYMERMWSNPPTCIAGLAREASGAVREKLTGGHTDVTVFSLQCRCFLRRFRMEGRSQGPYADMSTAISVTCDSCGRRELVFNRSEHGWDGELGHASDASALPDKVLTCPHCSRQVFDLTFCFQYRGDEVQVPREEDTSEEKAPQDLFGWFAAAARCVSCGTEFVAASIECR